MRLFMILVTLLVSFVVRAADYYSFLGVPFDATSAEISRAFHEKSKHAAPHVKLWLQEALDILSDHQARFVHDENRVSSHEYSDADYDKQRLLVSSEFGLTVPFSDKKKLRNMISSVREEQYHDVVQANREQKLPWALTQDGTIHPPALKESLRHYTMRRILLEEMQNFIDSKPSFEDLHSFGIAMAGVMKFPTMVIKVFAPLKIWRKEESEAAFKQMMLFALFHLEITNAEFEKALISVLSFEKWNADEPNLKKISEYLDQYRKTYKVSALELAKKIVNSSGYQRTYDSLKVMTAILPSSEAQKLFESVIAKDIRMTKQSGSSYLPKETFDEHFMTTLKHIVATSKNRYLRAWLRFRMIGAPLAPLSATMHCYYLMGRAVN